MRFTLTALLVCAFAPSILSAADARAEKLAAMKASFETEEAAIQKRFQAAEPEDRAKIRTEAKELYAVYAGKALRIAGDDPKDEVGLEASLFAAEHLLIFHLLNEDLDKALANLTHHINSPKLKSLFPRLAQADDKGLAFLKTVAEKSTDREVKGIAMYFIGTTLAEKADETDDAQKAQTLTNEAIGYLEKATKDAGDVKYGPEGTLAKTIEDELVGLKTLAIGKPAPEVSGTDLKTGHKTKLSSLRGKVVLLDAWATWCGPCKAMIPHSRAMTARLKDKPFVLVSVSADDEKKTLEEFLTKTEMPWTHWWDGPDGEVIKKYRVRAFPTLFLIDAKGVIRKKFIGAPEDEVLAKAVDELVAKANEK